MGVAAVIMAGGRGERFWPASRDDLPKQFLTLGGPTTLLQQTAARLKGIVSQENVWVVTREDYANLVREQLPYISDKRLLLEPEGRDTAPCVALAALHIATVDPDAVMLVLPSDHMILQEEAFRETLMAAIWFASQGEYLVTLGIRPTRPETGYGYIRVGRLHGTHGAFEAYRVTTFTEKPSRDKAVQYLLEGGYYWNSGIFVWKATTILAEMRRHMPELMEAIEPLAAVIGSADEPAALRRVYPCLPRLSIDYGVMERSSNALVIPASFGWDDLGSWAALERMMPADENGNVVAGRVLTLDTRDSVVQGTDNRLVVAFGVSNLVIVDCEDAVLVADKKRTADLKAIVTRLETEGFRRHLRRPRPVAVDRPV